MPKFIFAYHGGKAPQTPEEGKQIMDAWIAWFGKLGPAVIDGGNPCGMSKTVTAKGVENNGGANPVSGYSLISAPDMDAAVEIARGCPMVADGSGSVEVAEALEM
ncbi:MAG: hypothetical protein LJE67_07400 [Salaquimonas sp.]|nr:hypothetical protein [Salaquimonas sp.]